MKSLIQLLPFVNHLVLSRCSRFKRVIRHVVLRLRWSHVSLRVKQRYVRLSFRIEVDGWYFAELTNAVVDCGSENLPYSLLVLELYLGLGGMDINVNISCRHGEIYEIRHLRSHGNHPLVGVHHRLIEIRVLHISSVDKEILLRPLLLSRLRLTHKSLDAAHGGFHLHRQQVVVKTLAENIHYSLAQSAGP